MTNDEAAKETAMQAFRRIGRRKLLERGIPSEEVEARLDDLVARDIKFQFNVEEILGHDYPVEDGEIGDSAR